MSKVIGWTKHKGFICIGIPGNCLSELYKVAKGSLQGSIRQHIMNVWNVSISNFGPRLLAMWKLLMRLEKLSHTGAPLPFIYSNATQSLFQQEAALLVFFFSRCSFVILFFLNLLIGRNARVTFRGLQLVPVQMKTATVVARFPEAEIYKLSWILYWYPLPTTTPKRLSSQLNSVKVKKN